jgi:hypothetical protein
MKAGLAAGSIILLALSILLLVILTVFESALAGMSVATERALTFGLLVLPAAAGAALGVVSLTRREGGAGLAITGIVLNTLFGIFHLLLLLFAG